MKNFIKLALVVVIASATVIACDPPKSKDTEVEKTDSLQTAPDKTAVDSTQKADTLMKDSVKADTTKK